MKKIWIFQAGEPLHIDGSDSRPMRAMNLANFFVKKKLRLFCGVLIFIIKKNP